MARHRRKFMERRRTRLAVDVVRLDALEDRSLITDPIGLFATSLGIPLVVSVIKSSDGGG